MTKILRTIINLFTLVCVAKAFISIQSRYNFIVRPSKTLLRDVPLELTGQLDPKKTWDVKFIFRGEEKV